MKKKLSYQSIFRVKKKHISPSNVDEKRLIEQSDEREEGYEGNMSEGKKLKTKEP